MDLSILILVDETNSLLSNAQIQKIVYAVNKLGIKSEIVIAHSKSHTLDLTYLAEQGIKLFALNKNEPSVKDLKLTSGKFTITLSNTTSQPELIIPELWNAKESGDLIIYSEEKSLCTKLPSLIATKLLRTPFHNIYSQARLYNNSISGLTNSVIFHANDEIEKTVNLISNGFRINIVNADCSIAENSNISLKNLTKPIREILRLRKIRNSATSADYDHRAYDSIIPLQRYWQRKRSQIIEAYLVKASDRLLDIGCGSSRIIQRHPEAIAFDYSINKLRFLLPTNPFRVKGSTFALPFQTNSFKQVIHSQLLEHIPFEQSIFTELNRVMELGGVLVVGTPDYGRIWWPIIEFFYGLLLPNAYADEHITHYNRKSLTDLLVENGYAVQDFKYICGGELIIKAVKERNLV